MFRIGFGPGDLYRVHVYLAAEIDHHPLGVERIVLAGESVGQIRITLPIGFGIAVGEAGPSIAIAAAESAMRQWRSPGVPNHLTGRLGVPDKVSLLALGITPCAVRIPVPGL